MTTLHIGIKEALKCIFVLYYILGGLGLDLALFHVHLLNLFMRVCENPDTPLHTPGYSRKEETDRVAMELAPPCAILPGGARARALSL